jgi:hypothetical protein
MVGRLREFRDTGALSSALLKIVASPSDLAQVGVRSLQHANGFSKLVLAEGNRRQVRLHIWDNENLPGHARPLENAHNHRWPFATLLLAGAYTATTFQPSEGDAYAWHKYAPSKTPVAYELDLAGTCDLVPVNQTTLVAGSSYWVDPTVVHRVTITPDVPLTATLVLVGRHASATTDVFVPRELGEATAVGATPHRPMDPSEVANNLRRIATELTRRLP